MLNNKDRLRDIKASKKPVYKPKSLFWGSSYGDPAQTGLYTKSKRGKR